MGINAIRGQAGAVVRRKRKQSTLASGQAGTVPGKTPRRAGQQSLTGQSLAEGRGERRSSLPVGRIVAGDCVEILARFPDHSVDMVFADPPYFLQLKSPLMRPDESRVAGVNETWDVFDGFADYDRFTLNWLTACQRVLKKTGTIWVMGSYHNIFRLGFHLQNLGFWILNDVVWVKSNPMPNFRGTRLTNAHETLIWCSYERKASYRFNYASLKVMNDDKQMRSDWQFPLCTGEERIKKAGGEKLHPTQKPESLLYRVLSACTAPGDLVLDPFSGTGTTAAVAERLGRRWIGIERDPQYVSASRRRLQDIRQQVSSAEKARDANLWSPQTTKRAEPRVAFGQLLESGAVRVGESVISPCRCFKARICADASLSMGGMRGSIHQLGAAVQNRSACNGWTFWNVKRPGQGMIPLDHLRGIFRQSHETKLAPRPRKQAGRGASAADGAAPAKTSRRTPGRNPA